MNNVLCEGRNEYGEIGNKKRKEKGREETKKEKATKGWFWKDDGLVSFFWRACFCVV